MITWTGTILRKVVPVKVSSSAMLTRVQTSTTQYLRRRPRSHWHRFQLGHLSPHGGIYDRADSLEHAADSDPSQPLPIRMCLRVVLLVSCYSWCDKFANAPGSKVLPGPGRSALLPRGRLLSVLLVHSRRNSPAYHLPVRRSVHCHGVFWSDRRWRVQQSPWSNGFVRLAAAFHYRVCHRRVLCARWAVLHS